MRRGVTGATADIGWFVVSFVRTNYRSIGTAAKLRGQHRFGDPGLQRGFRATAPRFEPRTAAAGIASISTASTTPSTPWTRQRSCGSPIRISARPTQPVPTPSSASSERSRPGKTASMEARPGCVHHRPVGSNLIADGRAEVGIAYEDVDARGRTPDQWIHHRCAARHHAHRRRRQPPLRDDRSGRPAQQRHRAHAGARRLRHPGMDGNHGRQRSDDDGIEVVGLAAASQVVLRNNLIQNVAWRRDRRDEDDSRVDIYNNFIYDAAPSRHQFLLGTS